jgi:hypothetical protein
MYFGNKVQRIHFGKYWHTHILVYVKFEVLVVVTVEVTVSIM